MLGIGSGDAFEGTFEAAALVDQLVFLSFKFVCCTTQLEISLLGLSFHVFGPLLLLLEELRKKSLLFLEALPEHISVNPERWRRCGAQRSC